MVGMARSSNSPSCRSVSSIAVLINLRRKCGLKLKNVTSGKLQCQRQSTERRAFARGFPFWAASPRACFSSPCMPSPLDLFPGRVNIFTSPPIRFRIEWASGQGMSPLLDLWPILISPQSFFHHRGTEETKF